MINSFISDLSIYSHSTILFITTFIFRYLIIFRSENNFDVYGHLYFIKMVKENGKGPFESIQTNIISSKKLDYPFIWHWISGFIPDKIIANYNKAINPLIDSIYVLLVFIFSYKLGFSIKDIYLIILIYILSPIFFTKWNIGPRLFFTPRMFFRNISEYFSYIITCFIQ